MILFKEKKKKTNKFICIFSYYGVSVFSRLSDYQKLDSNKSLGRLIIFLGLCLIIISGVDLSKISNTITHSEQSIWSSNGKGIWIGLFIMCIGIFTLIAVKEQTHKSFNILLIYTIIGIILCFFGLLTSISVLERYRKDPYLSKKENRNKEESIQYALSGLLISLFALTFLFLSCLSCMICWTIPNFCSLYKGINPKLVHPSQRHGIFQEFPLRTPPTPRQMLIRPTPRLHHRPFIRQSIRPSYPNIHTSTRIYDYYL